MTARNALLCFAVLWLTSSVSSQIIIDQNDFPLGGQSYSISNGALTDEDPTLTGADFVWDYSQVNTLNTSLLEYIDVEDAPFTYQFLFNNEFNSDYLANAVLATEIDMGTDQISIDDTYLFYKTEELAHSVVGVGATISGIPIPSIYDPIDVVYDLPMTFGNEGGSESAILFSIPTLGSLYTEQEREYVVDGYGSVTTPFGLYECVRVKTIINAVDSLYIELIDLNQIIERPEQTTYSWLAKEEGVPVLEIISQGGIVTGTTYKDAPVNIKPEIEVSRLTAANGKVMWTTPLEQLFVFDSAGRIVDTAGNQRYEIDLNHLSKGIYIVTATWGGGEINTMKIVLD